jgi:hypothetical protein
MWSYEFPSFQVCDTNKALVVKLGRQIFLRVLLGLFSRQSRRFNSFFHVSVSIYCRRFDPFLLLLPLHGPYMY